MMIIDNDTDEFNKANLDYLKGKKDDIISVKELTENLFENIFVKERRKKDPLGDFKRKNYGKYL